MTNISCLLMSGIRDIFIYASSTHEDTAVKLTIGMRKSGESRFGAVVVTSLAHRLISRWYRDRQASEKEKDCERPRRLTRCDVNLKTQSVARLRLLRAIRAEKKLFRENIVLATVQSHFQTAHKIDVPKRIRSLPFSFLIVFCVVLFFGFLFVFYFFFFFLFILYNIRINIIIIILSNYYSFEPNLKTSIELCSAFQPKIIRFFCFILKPCIKKMIRHKDERLFCFLYD